MRAGTLRKVGMLQQRAAARDFMGGAPESWTDVRPLRYEITTTSSREMSSAENIRSMAMSTLSIRFAKDIQPGMRIRREPNRFEPVTYYNITAVNDVNGKHHELEATVQEDRTASP